MYLAQFHLFKRHLTRHNFVNPQQDGATVESLAPEHATEGAVILPANLGPML
jgi:hypothetical protein